MSILHNFISKCDNEQAILQMLQAEPFFYDFVSIYPPEIRGKIGDVSNED